MYVLISSEILSDGYRVWNWAFCRMFKILEFVFQVFVPHSVIILLLHGHDYCSMPKTAVNDPQTPCPSHMFSVSCRTSAPHEIQLLVEKGGLTADVGPLLEFKNHRQRKEQVRNEDKTAPSAPIQPRIQIRCHDDMLLPADFCLAIAYQSFWPEVPIHKGCDTALTILHRWSMSICLTCFSLAQSAHQLPWRPPEITNSQVHCHIPIEHCKTGCSVRKRFSERTLPRNKTACFLRFTTFPRFKTRT